MAASARRLESQFRLPTAPLPVLVPPLRVVESGLSEKLKAIKKEHRLTTGSELIDLLERRQRSQVVPTALENIDALLDGGLPRGKMIELAGRGVRLSIVTAALASATSLGESAAFIDLGDAFDPQLGESAGIHLYRMLWVRPKTMKQAVAAAEMVIATGFQLVVLDAGLPPLRGRVADAAWVRLARAAESHGTALFVSTPYPLTGTTSEAMLRAAAARGKWRGGLLTGIETTLRLEKHRRKKPGESVSLLFETSEQRAASGERETAPCSLPAARRSPL
ncbi:MAG TPA: hypothetical protein VL284_08315 [Thermoanaerobaculia bacterium]|nr:hypothetical protein [Thermoanaerobaculia bacterium]